MVDFRGILFYTIGGCFGVYLGIQRGYIGILDMIGVGIFILILDFIFGKFRKRAKGVSDE